MCGIPYACMTQNPKIPHSTHQCPCTRRINHLSNSKNPRAARTRSGSTLPSALFPTSPYSTSISLAMRMQSRIPSRRIFPFISSRKLSLPKASRLQLQVQHLMNQASTPPTALAWEPQAVPPAPPTAPLSGPNAQPGDPERPVEPRAAG